MAPSPAAAWPAEPCFVEKVKTKAKDTGKGGVEKGVDAAAEKATGALGGAK